VALLGSGIADHAGEAGPLGETVRRLMEVLGVAAAHGTRSNVLVAGVAGLAAGAMSMAAGEYVSVHSQADT